MNRLVAMSVFCKVVEHGSFTVAATRLDMSTASVSKNVSALEDHIGTPLLARTTRRIVLTDAGKTYYDKCSRILDDVEEAERTAGQVQTTPRGLLKVRAPISFGSANLGRLITAFTTSFPEVTVEMTLNDRYLDPAEEGVDVALYIGATPKHFATGAQAIATLPRMLVAAPSYLERHGRPREIQDLASHQCLVYTRGASPSEWRFTRSGVEQTVHVSGSLRCNNSQTLHDAALSGAGVGLLPAFLVAQDLACGRLTHLLPDWQPAERNLYAVYPQPRRSSPKVREFVELLASNLDLGSPKAS
ncbi:LysR family transcriptional regulator [Achromobacter sp. SD115]|uniref:LysR family transcriptional regulator n=1 Tax=Achromobacter sp. SD115 TaxID=2782011 RepID=UPI001A95D6F9|nr:LysR family transcriptional regulator [Achromobacter sp. SD115]MBO1012139.1 LysR family transcriptional regulator [Achromobacter sp. SD115]